MLVDLHGGWGWSIFGVIWGLAVAGTLAKLFYKNKGELLSTMIYLGMGWLIVIAIVPLIESLPWGGFFFLLSGGLCYSFGVIFFFLEDMPFNHAIWHLFVLAGTICHFFAVFFYVIPLKF